MRHLAGCTPKFNGMAMQDTMEFETSQHSPSLGHTVTQRERYDQQQGCKTDAHMEGNCDEKTDIEVLMVYYEDRW
jgi:hypothetical protein